MKYLIILVFLLTTTAHAQQISASNSFYGFGKILYVTSVSVEYKNVGLHYFHTHNQLPYYSFNNDTRFFVGKSQSTVALSYLPVNINNIIKAGMIFSPKRFPTSLASRFNFYVDLGIPIKNVRISYTHISNGFGVTNKRNPGIDSIKLTISLK